MIPEEQLAVYLDDGLDPAARGNVERQLEVDPAALEFVLEQRRMERVLRSVLAAPARKQRLRESILAALAGASPEQLRAQVRAGIARPEVGKASAFPSPPPEEVPGRPSREELNADHIRPRRLLARWIDTLSRHLGVWNLPRVAVAAACLAVAGWVAWWTIFRQSPAPAPEIGRCIAVIGSPTLRGADAVAETEVAVGTAIRLGDRLVTTDADRADIQFRDGTTLRLAFNTVVEIHGPSRDRGATTNLPARPSAIRLLQGQVWTQVAKLTNAPAYAIRTDAATAIARGTEFGVSLRRIDLLSTNPPVASGRSPVAAVLTVKEGTVDFTNALGSVRATAMTESIARRDSAPTEPRRLQTLQVVSLGGSKTWSLVTSPLDWPEAAARLAGGGGSAGLVARDFPVAAGAPAAAAGATHEVRIARVLPNSPAARAGLQPGDVVTAFDGDPVTRASQLHRALLIPSDASSTQAGPDPAPAGSLTLRRGDASLSVELSAPLQPAVLPGPNLNPDQQALLAGITRRWLGAATPQSTGLPAYDLRDLGAREVQRSPILRAAAENNLGIALELEDALGPAIRAYGRAVQADPNVPLYRFNLGLTLRMIGSFERAAEELAAAARLAPESTPAQKRLAEIHSLLGEDSAALAQTDAALQADPNDHGLWELKAQVLTKQRRAAEAANAGRRAAELDPTCPTAQGMLAGALHLHGNLVEAETVSRKALELAPYDPLRHLDLGVILNDRGRLADAEQAFRRALELQPDFVAAHQNLGNLFASRGQYAQARTAFEKAAELDPADLSAKLSLGRLALIQGRNDEAEARFREVVDASPHHVEALQALANVLSMKRSLPEAERLLRLARDIAPDSAGVHNDLGEVLRLRGRAEEALQSYRKAVELEPDNVNPMNNIAILQAMRGEHAEAEKMFRKLVERAATDRRLYPLNFLINLAMVCGKQGKLDEAEKYYRQALKMQPEDAGLGSSFAYFLAEHRRHLDEALTLARRAVEVAPNEFNYLDNLGWVLFQRREWAEAEKILQKAVDLAGQDPAAPEIREHLKKAQQKRGAAPR